MKIALCFSGQPRAYKKSYEYYKKNLLDHYDVDIYIHTWTMPDGGQELLDLLKPKAYQFEDVPPCDANEKYTRTPNARDYPPYNNWMQIYSMYKVSKLIEGHYDWVIRSRTDFALNRLIPFAELDNTKLYIPNCCPSPDRDTGNDQFAFSSQENMMKHMSVFEGLDEYYNAGYDFIGEQLMRANLHKYNLVGDNLVYYDVYHPFGPGFRNGTPHSLIRDDFLQWSHYK